MCVGNKLCMGELVVCVCVSKSCVSKCVSKSWVGKLCVGELG